MKSVHIIAPALAAILSAGALSAQPDPQLVQKEHDLRAEIANTEKKLTVARASGLRSIKVNGTTLPPEQVRREAIFLVGAKIVEAKISDFFVEEWMERAIEDGRDPAEFEIAEEDVKTKLSAAVQEFRTKNPGVEFWEAVRSLTGLSKDGYMRQQRNTELFNKVFFPGPATSWPSITKEAIMASAQGDTGTQFWETIVKSSQDPETGKPRDIPPFFMHLCRTWVVQQLKKWSDIRYPADGLPADVVLSVNSRTWKTDEAFEQVREAVFYQDIERAMTEVVIREALRQELVKADAYISDEDFRKAYEEYCSEFEGTVFTPDVIATAFQGYPCLEAFRQRWRLTKSFENMIADEMDDEALAAHAQKHAAFFSDGQANVDLIQFLAKDIKTGAWEPEGFVRAKERAEAAFTEIEGGADFDKVLDERGEFYKTDEAKGRLGSKPLNQLRQHLQETEFTDLLMGYSIGNHLFFEADVGTIVGPLRGPAGFYIARINARTPARGAPSLQEERTRDMVKQSYVANRLLEWSNDVLSRTRIE